jgi:thiamine pyrophosphokinase
MTGQMMKVLIVAGAVAQAAAGVADELSQAAPCDSGSHQQFDQSNRFDRCIGVDRGNLWILQHHLPLTAAVGDFDSVSADELERIEAAAGEVVDLPPEKDFTDLEVALDYAVSHYPTAEFVIVGALGGRLDHMMTNYRLPISEHFARFSSQVTLFDKQNRVRYYAPGTHVIPRIEGYQYIGFDQIGTDHSLSIEHAKYPLAAGNTSHWTWASNEFIGGTMTISFSKGFVAAIYSRDSR